MGSNADDGDEFSESDGGDDGFDEDMEALRRACILTGTDPNSLQEPSSTSSPAGKSLPSAASDSDEDDLELVRGIQRRLSACNHAEAPIFLKPLSTLPPAASDEDEDDFETLRAIQRRFEGYDAGSLENSTDNFMSKLEQVHVTSRAVEKETSSYLVGDKGNVSEGFPDSLDVFNTSQSSESTNDIIPGISPSGLIEWHQPDIHNLAIIPPRGSGFPKSAQMFVDAIKKNRACQKFLRSKLIQIEARIEENKTLMQRVKLLKDFQVSCKKRTGLALSQKKDARVQLISAMKPRASSKVNGKKLSPLYYGPNENSHVANYRMVLTNFPISLNREKWSDEERENLTKGVKQQFQELLLQKSVDLFSEVEGGSGDANDLDTIIASIRDHDITPENIRSFLPRVNWKRLASIYVAGHSGAECEARWLNCEDPLINHHPWSKREDKELLHIIQQRGISDWIEIAVLLGTNRTPFQCLARYQRSLNASILKREWTQDDDDKLRAAVETFGESSWQLVAATLEGRTGTQCSNRWIKSLHPSRQKVGRWTLDEDKRLKVAVMLFGAKNWNKIAQFVPGRTHVQCRERWVNCLDPSLSFGGWTAEEDSKLDAAAVKHEYRWSKVAACLPHRTDNLCMRRWRDLHPMEWQSLRAARKIQNVALISNFVDRESERPALGPNDFIPLALTNAVSETEILNPSGKQKRKPRSKRPSKEAQSCSGEVLLLTNGNEAENNGGDDSISKRVMRPRSKKKRNFEPTQDMIRTSQVGQLDWKTKKKRSFATRKRKFRGRPEEASMDVAIPEKERGMKSYSEENKHSDPTKAHLLDCADLDLLIMTNGEQVRELGGNYSANNRKASKQGQRRIIGVELQDESSGMINSDGIASFREIDAIFDKHGDATQVDSSLCPVSTSSNITNVNEVEDSGDDGARKNNAHKLSAKRTKYDRLMQEVSEMTDSSKADIFGSNDARLKKKRVTDHSLKKCAGASHSPSSKSSTMSTPEVEDFGDDGARKNNAHKLRAKRTKYDRLMQEVSEMTDSSKVDIFGSNDARLKKKRITDHSLKKCAGASHSPSSKSSTMSDRHKRSRTTENTSSNHVLEAEARDDMTLALFIENRRKKRKLKLAETGNLVAGGICPLHESLEDHLEGVNVAGDDSSDPCSPPPGFENRIFS